MNTKDTLTQEPPEKNKRETITIDPKLKKHTLFEDFQALTIGSLLVAFGVSIFVHKGFLFGGTAGLAFLGSYLSDFTFGQFFFVINLPFYVLGFAKLGTSFTLKTFVSVTLLSFFSDLIPKVFEFGEVNALFGAILAGLMVGTGLLMLFRHKASLGGLNIISLYLQKYHDVNAGRFQMVADVIIIVFAFFVVDLWALFYSVVAAICMNLVLAINFIKGRYLGSLD